MLLFDVYQFLKNPYEHFLKLQKKYGDPFALRVPNAPTIWLTARADYTKAIFTASSDSFKASEKNPVAPLLGSEGLIMLSGSKHLEERKAFTPYFSKKNLKPITSAIVDVFYNYYDEKSFEGTLSLQDFSFKSTLRIILRYLFPELSSHDLIEAENLTEDFLKSYSAFFLAIPQWVPGTWNNFKHKKLELDERFYDFYLRGKSQNALSPLSVLENKSQAEILDHIRTFIVAGHETSATSMTWALYYLSKDFELKTNLIKELESCNEENFIDEILQNKYLDSFVCETLRIHPPVPFVTRKVVNRDFKLGEREFKVDEEIGVCIALLHQDKSVWTNPSSFMPERFIDRKYSPYEYAPFGGGARKCIGAELAVLEMKILVGLFLKKFEFELLTDSEVEIVVKQITIGPNKPIRVKFNKVGESKLPRV